MRRVVMGRRKEWILMMVMMSRVCVPVYVWEGVY